PASYREEIAETAADFDQEGDTELFPESSSLEDRPTEGAFDDDLGEERDDLGEERDDLGEERDDLGEERDAEGEEEEYAFRRRRATRDQRRGGGRRRVFGRPGAGRPKPLIQDIFRRGQEVLVQVIKEGIGTKGP